MTITENMTKIDRKCVELGISRMELSRRSGVPIRTLEAWGKRLRVPRDVYVLQKVAQALECHIEDLIEPEPQPGAKA
jgi:DNA-binding Xre family transcriptional regulator